MTKTQKYGLTDWQIEQSDLKLKRNIKFMQDNGILLDNKVVPYSDFVQNAYINSNRYIAEIQHRAWNMFMYARDRNLVNMMLTLTLPTEWHKQKKFKDKLINNPKFGGRKYIATINKVKFLNCHVEQNIPFIEPILDFSQTIDKYTPRNASKELSKMLKKFFDDRAYKSIDTDNRCYFRVTEPHKDGTPHVHMSLFVPADKQSKIINSFNRLFPAPLGQIETDIKKPVSYLMKYVLKTLDDLRKNDKLSNLTRWYLYHGINRFYTSRTFINLDIYRKLKGEYNIQDLSEKYLRGDINVYTYKDTNKIALIENEFGTLYTPKPINWQDTKQMNEQEFTYLEAEFEPIYKVKEPQYIPVEIDGEKYRYYNGRYTKINQSIHDMNHFELFTYFEHLDIETCNSHHYINVENMLKDRGVISGDKLPLDSMEHTHLYFEREVF